MITTFILQRNGIKMRIFKVGDVLEPLDENNRITLDSYGQSPWTVVEGDSDVAGGLPR
jgi:hypothetical protein